MWCKQQKGAKQTKQFTCTKTSNGSFYEKFQRVIYRWEALKFLVKLNKMIKSQTQSDQSK